MIRKEFSYASTQRTVLELRGETPAKAVLIQSVINDLQINHNWLADIVFIQEANNGNQGAIYQYLNTSPLFQHPVATLSEGGSQSRSYIMAAGTGTNITQAFNTVPLIGDQGVLNWNSSLREV